MPQPEINKSQYKQARRLIRDNGLSAIGWMAPSVAQVMDALHRGQGKDRLAERADIVAWCHREGIACNPRQTA
ncbi:hypothetical protein ACMHYO_22730 [Allopusillimonas ginsengisoli]|uniref:hypothetical protein n=1 Tax=Allopusillimonas ginsengisoli TaxID=453575 RepID=UPI0039C35483